MTHLLGVSLAGGSTVGRGEEQALSDTHGQVKGVHLVLVTPLVDVVQHTHDEPQQVHVHLG